MSAAALEAHTQEIMLNETPPTYYGGQHSDVVDLHVLKFSPTKFLIQNFIRQCWTGKERERERDMSCSKGESNLTHCHFKYACLSFKCVSYQFPGTKSNLKKGKWP